MYGLSKLHKAIDSCSLPPLRPIVSSIGTYNYQLAKYLCNLLTPAISYDHCTKDSFTFADEIQKVRHPSLFMVSFDIESLLQTYLWLRQLIRQLMRYLKAILI